MPPPLVTPIVTPTPPTSKPPLEVGVPSVLTLPPAVIMSITPHASASAAVAAGLRKGVAIRAMAADAALRTRDRAFVHDRPTRRDSGAALLPERVPKPSSVIASALCICASAGATFAGGG